MSTQVFRINYKSDFVLNLQCDAGWAVPFTIKFWSKGLPTSHYFVSYDGTTYSNCSVLDDPTVLRATFDDHHLGCGELMFQITYSMDVDDFRTHIEDDVMNVSSVTIEQDGQPVQVVLNFEGETAPEIAYAMPAFAAEAARVAAEAQRVLAEAQREENELARQQAETQRQTEFEAAQEERREAFEQSQEEQDAAFSSAQQSRAQSFSEQAADFESRYTTAEQRRDTSFNTSQIARQNTFEGSERQRTIDYQSAEAQRDSDYQTAEEQRTTVFNASQASRQTAYETAEGTESGSVAGDGSRWGDFKTAEEDRQEVFDEKIQTIRDLETQVAELQAIVADLETYAEGYVRVAGSSSPALSYKTYKYHEQGGFGHESVFTLFYPCLVGTKLTGDDSQVGKILHVLQKLDYEHDIYGNARKIDGSEGDVMICNLEHYYSISGKHTINGTEYDVFLASRTPFSFQGIEAEEVGRYGDSPDYTVSHRDTDNVQRMHSVYNPEWNGSYNAPYGVTGLYVQSVDEQTGEITETFDANSTVMGGAGGLHTTDKNLYTAEQEAMNMNPDTTKMVPFANQTAERCNRLMAMLLTEGGTFDVHNANLMGSGFSSNDPADSAAYWEESATQARNGARIMDKDGNWKYYSFAGDVKFLTGVSSTQYAAYCFNQWRNAFRIMEAQRAVCHAIRNGVHEMEWFVFDGNRYKYRSVDGFDGPSHGEMTCVVWKLVATQAGPDAVDPTDGVTSIAGNRVELLVSTGLFHGITTQVSPSWWVSGLIFTEDEHGTYEAYIERDQESLIKSVTNDIDVSQNHPFEELYKHIVTINGGSGYATNYHNEALMMPDTDAHKTGGWLHTYVCKYNWFTGAAPPAGKKAVRGFRRGNGAIGSNLSPLAMSAVAAPSIAYSNVGFGTCCRIVP